jgi:hypothetical protein
MRTIQSSGPDNLKILKEKCQKKYKRGMNIVDIDAKTQLGKTFTPIFCVDPGRIFLTYERVKENVLGLDEKGLQICKDLVDTYDPEKELLFMCILVNAAPSEVHFYTIKVATQDEDVNNK